jgi:hypothetical protein
MSQFMFIFGCVALLTTPAEAESLQFCSNPTEPFIPSGYSADELAMHAAETAVQSYLDDVKSYLRCLADEEQNITREANGLLDQWIPAVARKDHGRHAVEVDARSRGLSGSGETPCRFYDSVIVILAEVRFNLDIGGRCAGGLSKSAIGTPETWWTDP